MAKKKTRWAAADCETDAFDGFAVSPFVWAYADNDGDHNIFWNTTEFIEWLRNFDGIVYAHNGGRFDWMMPDILNNIEEGRIRIINGRIAEAKVGKARIRDSWLCVPSALSRFGEKLDFDYEILKRENAPDRIKNKTEIEKYLLQDCRALFNVMERFITEHGFTLTQAGASLKTWEKMGGEVRRYGEGHDFDFRPYYFGGRCEVFEYANGVEGDFVFMDINSSYPRAMREEHTCGTDFFSSTNYTRAHPSSFWKIRAISKGALPIRDPSGRTIFPVDKSPRDYLCTGWEIHAALENNALDIVDARGSIPRRFESFAPYVNHFYTERKRLKAAGDVIGEQLAKIFMNSLYGKFGANPAEYRDYKVTRAGERPLGWALHMMLDEHDIVERPIKSPQFFDVAVAASITGYARAALMRGIFKSKRVMYCDTDSVLCERFNGETGAELGQWKKEADVKRIWIAGRKAYALELNDGSYKTAHKGFSKADIEVDDIKRAAAGETVIIGKSAPNCKIDGSQVFFDRTLKKT